MILICTTLALLLQAYAAKTDVPDCHQGNVVVKEGERAILTFDYIRPIRQSFVKLEHNEYQVLLVMRNGDPTVLKNHIGERLQVLGIINGTFSVGIKDIVRNDAGIFTFGGSRATNCKLQLIVTSQPVVSLKRKGRLLTCQAQSTTKPDGHNLPLVYTWFKGGVYSARGTRHMLIIDGREITCTVTDDPSCAQLLQTLTTSHALRAVLADERCKGVLAVEQSTTERQCSVGSDCKCPRGLMGVCRQLTCSCRRGKASTTTHTSLNIRSTTGSGIPQETTVDTSEGEPERNGLIYYIAVGVFFFGIIGAAIVML